MSFRVESIEATFPGRAPLFGKASFTILPGITGVTGVSGSGKTTLLRMLGGLTASKHARGTVRFGIETGPGADVRRAAVRRRFSYIFQTAALMPQFTARDNLKLGLIVNGQSPAAAETRVAAFLNQSPDTALRARADAYPHVLAGGERLRFAVAQALIREPDALFADEPFNHLDDANKRLVETQLVDWCRADPRRSLVLVSHERAAVFRLADHCLRLTPAGAFTDPEPIERARLGHEDELVSEIAGASA